MRKTRMNASFVRRALNSARWLSQGSRLARLTALLLLMLSLLGSLAEARVTRLQITSREVVADGLPFGPSGPYEKLRGRVLFEVDPEDPRNAVVFDLDKAPRNKRGMVEFSADLFILKPVDMKKGNGGLFFEVENAGNKLSLPFMNDAPPDSNNNNPSTAYDFGNGFLLRQGYTLAWVGWDVSNPPGNDRLTVQFPIALEDGEPITGLIITEVANEGGPTRPLRYEAISTDQAVAEAELRMRPSDSFRPPIAGVPDGVVIPRRQWSFARCPDGPPGTPSPRDVCLAGGFQTNRVYQLIYRATKSPVSGLGLVTTRDFVSFLRHASADEAGNPNPVRGITATLSYGGSRSGKYLRDFLYQGFNEDEHGRPVFDGVWVHVTGARKPMINYRFGAPDPGSTQHAFRFKPEDNFPRTYTIRKDPVTGRTDGILKRPASDPKVFHVTSSYEYWQAWCSLVDTDEDGTVDLGQPDHVRRYLFSSTQHSVRKGARPDYGAGTCQQLSNPTHPGVLARALLVALDQWVREGAEPPPSRVPRIDDGTLVPPDQASTGFPSIPGVAYNGLHNASGERYLGPRVRGNRGVVDPDYLIPLVLSQHRVLMPKVDAIGNEIGGIRHPLVEAPLATLTGWNLRRPEFTEGDLCNLIGMMICLPRTRVEGLAAGDPRPSLEELYGDHAGYVTAVAWAALNLWAQRLMLLEDVFQTIGEADEQGLEGCWRYLQP